MNVLLVPLKKGLYCLDLPITTLSRLLAMQQQISTQMTQKLPNELLIQIFGCLIQGTAETQELVTIAQINTQFNYLLKNKSFWSTYVNKNYKHADFDIYTSVLEAGNIMHKIKKNLNIIRDIPKTVCPGLYPDAKNYVQYAVI